MKKAIFVLDLNILLNKPTGYSNLDNLAKTFNNYEKEVLIKEGVMPFEERPKSTQDKLIASLKALTNERNRIVETLK